MILKNKSAKIKEYKINQFRSLKKLN